MSDPSLLEKSLRSVFVGNIPYEVTEEKMKIIFSDVGQVVSFKLVIDRDTGKSKGYGFCEYRDKETAQSAMRNLNNYEMGGRNLRVDIAGTERSRMEMANMQAQQKEKIYGEECKPEDAEQTIIEQLSSLSPEQMNKIICELKTMIDNNPSECCEMLSMNPQLAYAILHIGFLMNCFDKETALSMIYSPREKLEPFAEPSTSTYTPSSSWGINIPSASNYQQQRGYQESSTSRGASCQQFQSLTVSEPSSSSSSSKITEEEKSNLIMQVLNLTNEQISCLAPEQRQSILLLRNQIIGSKLK